MDLPGLLELKGQGRARGDGDARADDPVGPEDAQVLVGDVHRPALAFAVARRPGVKLGEHGAERASFGEDVAVATVRPDDVVVALEGRADPDRDSLLADVSVEEARQLSRLKKLDGLLLEEPDAEHVFVQAEIEGFIRGTGHVWQGPSTRWIVAYSRRRQNNTPPGNVNSWGIAIAGRGRIRASQTRPHPNGRPGVSPGKDKEGRAKCPTYHLSS